MPDFRVEVFVFPGVPAETAMCFIAGNCLLAATMLWLRV